MEEKERSTSCEDLEYKVLADLVAFLAFVFVVMAALLIRAHWNDGNDQGNDRGMDAGGRVHQGRRLLIRS